ncbi:hypothetical protein TTRE_0000339901 [Trichuris trichiura]|uniref:Poly(A) RNA polymerase mitochondrial-like central palm domain-containing protein n=1 Tax=Trichuris trichiura TaxID=36087 RepID=A0A077Z677_TRITR|nr:hypothetical protein TTRE_0000339901 [Trichuris trichiura]
MDTDSNQSTIVPNGANSAGASKRTKLPTALLVARKRDAPLDERAIMEYFGQNFGPVVSCHLGSRKNYKMRLQFASQASLAKAASQKIVNVGDVKIRVLHADTGPAVKKHFDIRESFRFKEAKSLDEQAVVIHNENRIHSVKGHLSFCQKLETHLQKYFNVTIRIKMFGSSATGFGWNSSDIDITLIRDGDAPNSGAEGRSTGPSPENGDGQSVEDNHSDKEKATMLLVEQRQVGNRIKLLKMIGKFLNNFPLVQRSVVIPSKHCPILLFRNALKLQCEMSIENLYGLTKTAWLNYLSLVHGPWLPRLFSTVRYWLSFHLNATTRWRTKFNSYCLLLILVTYLQTEGLIEPASEYSKDKEPVKNSTVATESGLITRLFLGFVNFLYGTSAYWEHCVFRPRLGIVERNLSGFMLEHSDKFKYSWLNVEDPFEVEHNPGSTIVYTVLESLKIILMNAREELQSPSSLLPLRPIHKCLPSCRRLLKETMSARRRELSIKPDQQLYNRIQRYINGLDKSTLNSEYIVCLFYECCVRCLLTLLGPVFLFEITQPQVANESMQHLMEELVVDPSKAGDRFGPWPLKVTCRSTACTWQDRTNRAYKRGGSVYKQYPFPSETELSRRIAAKESWHKNETEGTLQFEMEAELKNDDNIMSVSVRFHSACCSAQLNRFLHCYMILIKKYLFTCFEHFLPLPE